MRSAEGGDTDKPKKTGVVEGRLHRQAAPLNKLAEVRFVNMVGADSAKQFTVEAGSLLLLHFLQLAAEVAFAIPSLDIAVDRGDVVMPANLRSQATRPHFRLIESHDLVPTAFARQQRGP